MKLVLSIIAKAERRFTSRICEIARTFGLKPWGIELKVDRIELEFEPGWILCIVGESGSGKTLFLNELYKKLSMLPEFGRIMRDEDVKLDPEEIIVEGVGRDAEEAVRVLSRAGLSDAPLLIKTVKELSDGQRFRYRLAKFLDRKADTWIIDEFASALDRVTAKTVSYTFQKAARRLGATVVLATPDEDLLDDIRPDVVIRLRLGQQPEVRYGWRSRYEGCSLLSEVVIEEGSFQDYERLSPFHYRSGNPKLIRQIFKATVCGELAGVILYSPPFLTIKAREVLLPDYKGVSANIINKDFTRISRIIVHPRFRGIGLGVKLVKETMPLTQTPYVECLAAMARYNPFLEKAGMLSLPLAPHLLSPKLSRLTAVLEYLGIDTIALKHREAALEAIKSLPEGHRARLLTALLQLEKSRKLRAWLRLGVDGAIVEALRKLALERAIYLVWKNPAYKNHPDPIIPKEYAQIIPAKELV